MLHRHSDFGMEKSHVLGDGMIAGFGKINGRRVCMYASDFTVLGGSFGEVAGQKVLKIMDLAMQAGVPVIGLNDGGGARIQEGVYSLCGFRRAFLPQHAGQRRHSPDQRRCWARARAARSIRRR